MNRLSDARFNVATLAFVDLKFIVSDRILSPVGKAAWEQAGLNGLLRVGGPQTYYPYPMTTITEDSPFRPLLSLRVLLMEASTSIYHAATYELRTL